MAAKNQHYLPQFLLRQFASRVEGDQAYVHAFRRGTDPHETNTRNVGSEGYFYSRERSTEVERRIGDHEQDHARLVARLNDSGVVSPDDSPRCASLVAQLMVRTRHMREGITEALVEGVRETLGLALNSRELERQALEMVKAELKKLPPRLRPNPAALAAVGLAALRGEVARMPPPTNAVEVRESARQTQTKALEDGAAPRAASLASVKWRVHVSTGGEKLVLSDVGPIGFDASGGLKPGYAFQSDRDQGVMLPLSPRTALVGNGARGLADTVLDSMNLNRVSACLSRDFFVSSECGDAERRLQSLIGSACDYYLQESREAIRRLREDDS
jgi:hypothetical protein